jgi:membrane protein implicated in regulation of membrane protease activity
LAVLTIFVVWIGLSLLIAAAIGHDDLLQENLISMSILGLTMITAIILSLIVLILGIIITFRYVRKVNIPDESLCPKCGYDMRGCFAANRHLCPECGLFIRY